MTKPAVERFDASRSLTLEQRVDVLDDVLNHLGLYDVEITDAHNVQIWGELFARGFAPELFHDAAEIIQSRPSHH